MKCPDCGLANIEGADDCAGCHASLSNPSPKSGLAKKILEGVVSDLSPKKAIALSPSDTLLKAVEAMRAAKSGCVLAVENGQCAGILSERELILKISEKQDAAKIKIKEIMHADPTCLLEGDEVAVAFHRMAFSAHLHMPVRMQDNTYRVISARDLLRYLCKQK